MGPNPCLRRHASVWYEKDVRSRLLQSLALNHDAMAVSLNNKISEALLASMSPRVLRANDAPAVPLLVLLDFVLNSQLEWKARCVDLPPALGIVRRLGGGTHSA